MEPNDSRALVFISCGQRKGTDEEKIANDVAEVLQAAGFEPYISIREQTQRGLKENIFDRLERAEYFVFIDFKRELMTGIDEEVANYHRGSLFSNQELAIASFRDIPSIFFQEEGVKTEDGLMHFLQTNCHSFSDRNKVAQLVDRKVKEVGWSSSSRNKLIIETPSIPFTTAIRRPQNIEARFYHLSVNNLHNRKTAKNCFVYLESIYNSINMEEIKLKTIEFKWAGYVLPNAVIGPNSSREFDAYWIRSQNPQVIEFNTFSDSSDYIPMLQLPGKYELTYSVISDNFPKASITINSDSGDIQPSADFNPRSFSGSR
jgi:hypothetical protein